MGKRIDAPNKESWKEQLEFVSKSYRNQVILEAHEVGKLSHREIAEALGDVSRQRVMQLIKELREKRAEEEAEDANV